MAQELLNLVLDMPNIIDFDTYPYKVMKTVIDKTDKRTGVVNESDFYDAVYACDSSTIIDVSRLPEYLLNVHVRAIKTRITTSIKPKKSMFKQDTGMPTVERYIPSLYYDHKLKAKLLKHIEKYDYANSRIIFDRDLNVNNVLDLLKKHVPGAIIAGGSILTTIAAKQEYPIDDIDIWVIGATPTQISSRYASFIKDFARCVDYIEVKWTKTVVTIKSRQIKTIQLVMSDKLKSPADLLNTFDLPCCKAAYIVDTEKFVCTRDFLYFLLTQQVRIEDMPYVTRSLPRIFKYANRGMKLTFPRNISQKMRCELDLSVMWAFCIVLELVYNKLAHLPVKVYDPEDGFYGDIVQNTFHCIVLTPEDILSGRKAMGYDDNDETLNKLPDEIFIPLLLPSIYMEKTQKPFGVTLIDQIGRHHKKVVLVNNLKDIETVFGKASIYEDNITSVEQCILNSLRDPNTHEDTSCESPKIVLQELNENDTIESFTITPYINTTRRDRAESESESEYNDFGYSYTDDVRSRKEGHLQVTGRLNVVTITLRKGSDSQEKLNLFDKFIDHGLGIENMKKFPRNAHSSLSQDYELVQVSASALPNPDGYSYSRSGKTLLNGIQAMLTSANCI